MAASVRNQWQGDARDGQKSHIHADVYEKVRREKRRESQSEKSLEVRRSAISADDYPPNQDAEDGKKYEDADESPLFGKGGENKICLIFGQKFEARLRAVADAFAENSARADGDSRLPSVVAGALNIRERVKEGQDAVFLVLGETKIPEQSESRRLRDNDDDKMFF